jgi:hypothetical protein
MRYKDIIFLVCLGCLLMAAVHIYGQNDDLFNHEKKLKRSRRITTSWTADGIWV